MGITILITSATFKNAMKHGVTLNSSPESANCYSCISPDTGVFMHSCTPRHDKLSISLVSTSDALSSLESFRTTNKKTHEHARTKCEGILLGICLALLARKKGEELLLQLTHGLHVGCIRFPTELLEEGSLAIIRELAAEFRLRL